MEPRIYRPGWIVWAFGLGFTLIPLVFILPGIYGLITGTAIPFSTEDERSTRPGTTTELLLITFFPMIHLALGLGVLLYCINARILVSEEGVQGKDWRGRTSFEASWRELTSIEHTTDGEGGGSYYLHAGNHKLRLMDRKQYEEITEDLKLRSPHLKTFHP